MATTHNMSKTRIYAIWNAMHMRCEKPSQDSYAQYGGRGIKVCERWSKFENFYEDMGDSYTEGLSIDRIDIHDDYKPSNCRWATALQQARNTSRTKWFTINGITRNLSAWIEDCGIKSSTVRQRVYVYGWDIEKALYTPASPRRRVTS